MRRTSHFSMALALAAGSATAFAVALPTDAAHAFQKKDKKKKGKKSEAEGPVYDLSDEYRAQIVMAQELLAGADNAATTAAVSSLEALTVNDDEKYLTGQMMLTLSTKTGDKALQKKALEMSLSSPRLSQKDQGFYNVILGEGAFLTDKDYIKAQEYFGRALALGYETPSMMNQYAEAKFSEAIAKSGGNTITVENAATANEGLVYLARAIELPDQKNPLNKAALYKRGTNISSAINSPDAMTWASNYVKFSPNPDSWYTALSLLRRTAKYDDQTNLDLMRLMRRTGAMQTTGDYAEYTENADAGRLPGEVSVVLDEGVAAGKVNASEVYFRDALSTAKGNIAEDRRSLPSAVRSAEKSVNGKLALATGDAYLGYAEPSKATELYKLALQKGGIDNDRALIRLGISHTDLGNYDEAREAFSKVQGNSKKIADMWLLWIDHKDADSAAATM